MDMLQLNGAIRVVDGELYRQFDRLFDLFSQFLEREQYEQVSFRYEVFRNNEVEGAFHSFEGTWSVRDNKVFVGGQDILARVARDQSTLSHTGHFSFWLEAAETDDNEPECRLTLGESLTRRR